MAHLVCQYIEFSNGGGSHRHIIGKRTDRASIGTVMLRTMKMETGNAREIGIKFHPARCLAKKAPASPNSPEKAPPPQLTSRAALGAFSSMIWIFGFPYGITLMLNL